MSFQTPLYELHRGDGARFVDFAGWEMPIQFQSITAEHKVVREQAGLFDVSHMGRFWVRGGPAARFLEWMVPSRVADLTPGRVRYTVVLNPEGGIKDDILVTCLRTDLYMLVVNASNRDKLFSWFRNALVDGVECEDRTFESGMMAIQGPASLAITNRLLGTDCSAMKYYHAQELGEGLLVSRTGYTGEDGFEIIAPAARIVDLWRQAREMGARPAGLGARDSLRLEMGYALYGHELSEEITPLEAGLERVIAWDKDFIGKDALLRQKEAGPARHRIGFRLTGKGIPRQGCLLFEKEEAVGLTTSGGFSPVLGIGIGLGLVRRGHPAGEGLAVEIRGQKIPAQVVQPPFVAKRVKS
ncbi:MAG TPA: glycine cleavage system aminomethyltransferase GcvT [bacterium]|nr:glycine cleavage system aminomethyltransferase GcvT [bacterium]HPP00098.1 glycine cleavage system aminomethyltransferase GcvT [bacterium]